MRKKSEELTEISASLDVLSVGLEGWQMLSKKDLEAGIYFLNDNTLGDFADAIEAISRRTQRVADWLVDHDE